MRELYLGVNIDHVATLRQARGTQYPEPVHAVFEAISGGADLITLHMREDLRHIQARDVRVIREILQVPMNLELAVTDAMIAFAKEIKPTQACFVPEKREELTTEGGLDVVMHYDKVSTAVKTLQDNGSRVSLFIDPEIAQIDAALATGAEVIELHTGAYAEAEHDPERQSEFSRIAQAARYASQKGLIVDAGHGLHYHNVKPIAALGDLHTLNIGHAIVAHAIFCGLQTAVREMKILIQEARQYIHE